MLVDEGDIVTCGGATSFLNLMIYLVEKYFGHDLTVHASKIFLIDMDRPSQLPFKIHKTADRNSKTPFGNHWLHRFGNHVSSWI